MIKNIRKPLIKSNPYLRNPQKRQAQFITGVISSSSIEGVVILASQLKKSVKLAAKRK